MKGVASPAPEVAAEPERAIGRNRYLSHDPKTIWLAVTFGAVVFLVEWFRHATFRSQSLDLALFDQALWLMAHGREPFATVIGLNVFTDHFSPVLVLLVPFYWLAPTPLWLFAAQATAMAVGLLALGPMLNEFNLSDRWRLSFFAAYVSSPLLWSAALFDFHTGTLAVPFLIAGITASLRDDLRRLAMVAPALILIRDDFGLAVVALMLLGSLRSKHVRSRIAFGLVGLAWTVVVGRFGQAVQSLEIWRAHYGYLGPSPQVAEQHLGRTAARIFGKVWSVGNLNSMIAWLLPLGFLSLLSPLRASLGALWLIPILASARLSIGDLPAFHHGATVLPFLILAAATGVARVRHRLVDFAGPAVLVAFTLSGLAIANPFATWITSIPAPPASLARQALAYVRPSDRVTATSTLGAHLSHRVLLLPFPYPFMKGDDSAPRDRSVTRVGAEEVARIDAVAIYLGFDGSSVQVRRAFLRSPFLRDFRMVFDREGLIVFRRLRPTVVPQSGSP